MPNASGPISGCSVYANYNASANTESDCEYIAFAYQVTTDQLLAWNPSLSSNLSTCSLQNEYSYCVEQTNATSTFSLEAVRMKRMLTDMQLHHIHRTHDLEHLARLRLRQQPLRRHGRWRYPTRLHRRERLRTGQHSDSAAVHHTIADCDGDEQLRLHGSDRDW